MKKPVKIKAWSVKAQKAVREKGVGVTAKATEYCENHISQCLLGKRKTTPFLANALEVATGIPAQEFGQIKKRVKA